MSSEADATHSVGTSADGSSGHSQSPGLIDVSNSMLILTWITFGILAAILYKTAWKPILKGLKDREDSIRKAIEDAEKARAEVAAAEERMRKMNAEAQAAGEAVVAAARKSASELAASIEKRAKDKTTAMVDDARREIGAATDKARVVLRAESAKLAIELAGKIVGENMDSGRNRELIRKLVAEN